MEDKKKTSKKSKEDVIVKNSIEINPKLEEAKGDTVVLGWGRMNPITSGHEKLVNKIKEVARKNNATPLVYVTHTQDKKKNPLSYSDKIKFAQLAFGKVIQKSNAKTIMQALAELNGKFSKLILVVGADRIKEFETLLGKYNGKDYNFDSIEVVSAGDRADPDSEEAKTMTADAMSASVMRKLASEGDFEKFKKGLPKKLVPIAQEIYDMVRAGMKIAEELEAEGVLEEAVLNYQQRRKRALVMRKYKNKIAIARKKAMRKLATADQIKNRARKAAIKVLRKKVAGSRGQDYNKLSAAEKMLVDKKVVARQAAIDKIAKRLVPVVRQKDRQKFRKEDVNLAFEEMLMEAPTKRYHEARKKDGSIKLDRRFKIWRNSPKPVEESFNTDEELLAFIENLSHEISDSVSLEESKIEKALEEKAERHGLDIEEVKAVYDSAIAEGASIQDAFASVNIHLAKLKEAKKIEKDEDDPCWAGYVQLGTKKKNGKEVPNCVPKEEIEEARRPSTLTDLDVEEGDKIQFYYSKHTPRLDATVVGFKNGKVNVKTKNGKVFALNWEHEAVFAESVEIEEKTTMQAIKGLMSKTVSKKKYAYAKDLLQKIVDRKKAENNGKLKHNITWYAATVADQIPGVDARTLAAMMEEGGAGDEGTNEVVKKYKKDTPNESLNEAFEEVFAEEVTQQQIKDLEKFADRLLDKFGVDVEFTRHFADRMNDERNDPKISIPELQRLFKKIAKNKAKDIKANANTEAVLKDIQSDLNLPIVIKFNRDKEEFEIVNKTIMRKKDFKTSNTVIKY